MKEDMIHTPERAGQIVDFRGLNYKNLHPMDIDGVLEFDDDYLVLVELKVKNSWGINLQEGQKLTYQRIAKAWAEVNKGAVVVYCTHDTKPEEIIYLEEAIVDSVYDGSIKKTINLCSLNLTFKKYLRTLAAHWDNDKLRNVSIGDIK
jgi:hypothetical protein